MTRTKPRRSGDRKQNGRSGDPRASERERSFRPPSPHFPPPPRYPPSSYAPSDSRNHQQSDSWRPSDRRGDPSGRPYRDEYRGSDSYRSRPPQGDFTFRFDKPSGIPDLPPPGGDSYRPNDRNNDRRGNRRDARGRNRRPGRPRWQPPPPPSERALISGITANLPEERLGNLEGSAKFRDLNELSDDDELAMDISSSSEDSDSEGPSKKRVKTSAASDADPANAAPKWSNPDPYTALPCPDETTRKKRDVVKLIRKARLEEEAKPAAPTEAEDFISFDLTEDEESEEETPPPPPPELPPQPPPPPPPGAPTGPRAATRNPPTAPPKSLPLPVPDRDGPLGSRKRTIDDMVKPPDYGQLKKATTKPSKGSLVPTWEPKPEEDPTPWATRDHTMTVNTSLRFHKEVKDFFEYVKPRDFEKTVRHQLVADLQQAMKRDGRNFKNATVYPFGSFMSGLYLPTADMDVVVCSQNYLYGGSQTYLQAKSWLYKFQKLLQAQRMAENDSIEVIAHARVPLVKYVDRKTGLKVDVSFENLGGVTAVGTFDEWKREYPAMPMLVTVLKHFLLMRGLNEPVNGGIGGFTVICMVVSMLQMMPQVQSGVIKPEDHLGEMLLEFFHLYGSNFEVDKMAISLTKPGYIRKSEVRSLVYKNTNRLSIIDPNNPANDISGGSSNIAAILAQFREAYDLLRARMSELSTSSDAATTFDGQGGVPDKQESPKKGGILDVIMSGDYSTFRMQRDYLRHVHEKHIGPCIEW